MMQEALLIAGAIFFLAGWTTPSKHDSDLALPIILCSICIAVSMMLWWTS